MDYAKHLRGDFARSQWVIERQAEGLSHEDSLRQPPFRGNCLNWVLGHVAVYRGQVITALGGEDPWPETLRRRYARESAPIGGEDAAPRRLEELLEDLKRSKEAIDGLLRALPAEALDTVFDTEKGTTLAARLSFLAWHEAYHVGQTEQLRQLAGKDDQVI